MFARCVLAAAAFVAAASAQGLTITNPSPSSWWVAGSSNTLAWTCTTSPYSDYNVVLANSNTTILTAPLALISDVPNYDCSYTVNQQQSSLTVSDTWTIQLTSITNISDIYASAQFSVEAQGSSYPTTTSSGASSSGTSTAGSSSSTSTSKSGAAAAYIPVGMSMAAAALLGLVVA